jgi:hypothetical protein
VTPARRDTLFDVFLQATLRAGIPYWWRPRGFSMSPAIEDGDRVLVESVDPADLRVGDIVKVRFESQFLMHRLVRRDRDERGEWLTLRGDNAFEEERVPAVDVIGRALAVERRDHQLPERSDGPTGSRGYLWAWLFRGISM